MHPLLPGTFKILNDVETGPFIGPRKISRRIMPKEILFMLRVCILLLQSAGSHEFRCIQFLSSCTCARLLEEVFFFNITSNVVASSEKKHCGSK